MLLDENVKSQNSTMNTSKKISSHTPDFKLHYCHFIVYSILVLRKIKHKAG